MREEVNDFAERDYYSQRQSGISVTGDDLSNTYRTSVLGVAQYRVQISVPVTARATMFFIFGINQLVSLYGT
jgi:hypothetical protein